MTEHVTPEPDQDPQPTRYSDAERASDGDDEQLNPEEIEQDPAHSPEDDSLRDVKGG